MSKRSFLRGVRMVLVLASALALGACGAGGGGAPPLPVAALTVLPLAFSAEASQAVALTVTTSNVTTPVFTYTLQVPVALTAATADEVADQFGTLNATTGAFTAGPHAVAGLRGSILVRETSRSLSYTVPLVIVPFVDHVTITPDETSLLANATQSFDAVAYDINGQPIADVLPDWRTAGGIGSVNADGLFHALTAGTGTVTARIGGAEAATAHVTVVGSVTGLSIQPASNPIVVEAGTQRQFKAIVRDASNHETEVVASWQVTAAAGSVTAAGLLTASTTVGATGTLTASYQSQTASLPVQVVALVTPPSGPANLLGTITLSNGQPAAGALVEVRLRPGGTLTASVTATATGAWRALVPAGVYDITGTLGSSTAAGAASIPTPDVVRRVDLQLAP